MKNIILVPKSPLLWLFLWLSLWLSGCKQQEIPQTVVRPALIWTIGEQAQAVGASYSGEVRARYEADLAFRVGGKVTGREVDIGDKVVTGQVLARLDTADLKLNLDSARAALKAAQADYSNASTELDRVRELRAKQFIGQSALDTAQAARDAAAARVDAAKAQLKLSDNQTAYSELKVDRPGIITAVYTEVGQVVAAGSPVVHIAYEGEREVYIHVGESTARNLATGSAVTIKFWSFPDQSFKGKVREVSPAVDVTRSFLVKLSVLNAPDKLRLGVTADVSLPVSNDDKARWLPSSALFQQGKQTAVWVLDSDNRVSLHDVEVIAYHEDGMSITGLADGTRVIAAGVHTLGAGQTINPVPYDGKAGS